VSLRHKLADYGFESNDDYDFPLRCLLEAELPHLRVLHVDGHAGRRKTAFANALAQALEYPHVIYHDFSRPPPPPAPVVASADGEAGGTLEAPLSAFERAVTEACAYSEADRAMLILDQLQAADFVDQVRLYRLASTLEWTAASATVMAHPRNLLMVVISEEILYHSLARLAYRVWTDAERAFLDYRPEDFGLGRDAQPMFDALTALFEALGSSPTPSAFAHLLRDVLLRVRTEEQLRHALFGWSEQLDRMRLHAPELSPLFRGAVDAIGRYVGLDHIEM
jgi:hypothetical protein